ncbi:GIY-YIG nuclease family protein [candidate division KSB1 bacterium]|nr:GIY-YIG nuclease family protein [candidate division KSB1 bacterium]MBL7094526.1 GIY-YIG nuclease family protein [candidate division KSB1 bacterium]
MTKKNQYWIYILECENGCYYTGYSKDLERRYKQHIAGTSGSKYTRSFKPKRIIQCWKFHDSIGTALKIEQFIKRQSRKFKDKIIEQPIELEMIILKRLNLELEIIPVDPKSVEDESLK